jgi:hypothetical protein
MADRDVLREGITSFIAELERLRNELAGQILKRLRTELKRTMVDRAITTIETNRTLEIVTAKDTNDKPMYPNETHRKAQLQAVLDADNDYQKMLRLRDRLTKAIYRLRCEEYVTDAQVKKFESLERLYFIDLENK